VQLSHSEEKLSQIVGYRDRGIENNVSTTQCEKSKNLPSTDGVICKSGCKRNFLTNGSNIIISIFAFRSTGDGIIKELYLEHQGD